MSKFIKMILCLLLAFSFVACSSNKDKNNDSNDTSDSNNTSDNNSGEINLDSYLSNFQENYEVYDIDTPFYDMIGATDGISFYIGNDVVKIYQFDDENSLDAAIELGMTTTGLFAIESSNEEYVDFFINLFD